MQVVSGSLRRLAVLMLASVALSGCGDQGDGASNEKTEKPEVSELRIGRQLGIGYLPLYIMQEKKLVEKYAKQEGLDAVNVTYTPMASPAVINDSMLGGNLDIGSAGIVPFFVLWDKTKGSSQAVRMFGSLAMQPLVLTTNRADLKSFADLNERDRIAVPAIKTSMNAMLLSMAAEKYLGPQKVDFVDALQVPFGHADAVVSLLSGQSAITAHMATMPFSNQALESPKIHKVFSSYDITDGPSTIMALWAKQSFYDDNPRLMRAVYAALNEASKFIEDNKKDAAKIYIGIEKSKLSESFVEGILKDPDVSYSLTPQKTFFFADWLYKHNRMKNKPNEWKDFFFDPVYVLPGS